MIYGYIRTGEEQKTILQEDQIVALNQYARDNKIQIDEWLYETICPARSYNKEDREEFFSHLQEDDTLLTNKLALFGVNLVQIMHLLQYCLQKNIKIISTSENLEVGNKEDIKALLYAFNISIQIEKELIAQRNKQAFESLKEHGTSLGRKLGAKNKNLRCDKHRETIEKLLGKNIPVIRIAEHIGCDRKTLASYIKNTMTV